MSDRSRSAKYNPDDTWDNYVPKDFSSQVYESKNVFENAPTTTEDNLLQSFHNTNAMQALQTSTATKDGREFLNLQDKHRHLKKTNQNILPSMIRTENMIEEPYVGTLSVEFQTKNGTMVDRLGNEFDVWESEMPLPDKDYTNTATPGSDRRLERVQGYNINDNKKKSEVQGITHPAEQSSRLQQNKVHKNNLELNNRDAYLNKNGLQPIQEIDEGRDMYEGYNMAAHHDKRTFPLEHCWRNDLSKPVATRKESSFNGKSTSSGLKSKRKEITSPFALTNKSRLHVISAKSARVTLPIVSDATVRSKEHCIHKSSFTTQGNILSSASNATIESINKQSGLKPVDNIVTGTNEDLHQPVILGSIEARQLQRDNGAIEPTPSREWNLMQQMIQDIDKMADDDIEVEKITGKHLGEYSAPKQEIHINQADVKEVAQISQNGMDLVEASITKQNFDHKMPDNIEAKDPTKLHSSTVVASMMTSDVNVNETREMIAAEAKKDLMIQGPTQKGDVEIHGTDSKESEHNRAYTDKGSSVYAHVNLENERTITYIKPASANNHLLTSNTRSNIELPKEDNATFIIRPGAANISSNSHMISTPKISNTFRNNSNTRTNSRDATLKGDNTSRLQLSDIPLFEENATYSRIEAKQSHINSTRMQGTFKPSSSAETSTFARTQSSHAETKLDIRSLPTSGNSLSGLTDKDRIHTPHQQDWRKNEMVVEATSTSFKDRSTPVRAPSRSVSTPVRWTPSVQIESNREMAKN